MNNNDVLRSLRYVLNINDEQFTAIFILGGANVQVAEVSAMLKFDSDEGFLVCDDATIAAALDGVVVHKRGKDESRSPPPVESPITNNTVLKKLRVAFELKEDDMHDILQSVNCSISKPEMSALFRKPGHKNYRECGDQILRNFLKGLALRTTPVKS